MDTSYPDKNATFFRFEDLRIYHKAVNYATWVHKATENATVCANDNLCVRFNETARSIAINIAEGSARNKNQFIYYLKMAKSDVRACLVLTTVVTSMGLIDESQEDESRNYLMEMTKMIGALISSLQRGPNAARDEEDPLPKSSPQAHPSFNDEDY